MCAKTHSSANSCEPPARRRSRARIGASALAALAVALGTGASPAQAAAPGPKPSPAPSSAAPGATTKDPSTADRAAAQQAAAAAAAQGIADRPYLGWSSWSMQSSNYPGLNPGGFGNRLTEANLLPQVDALASKLEPYGYEYVNIDAGWSRTTSWAPGFDQYGWEIASPERFPHGMKYVADYVHGKGLKAGIYLAVGLAKEAYNNGGLPAERWLGHPGDAHRRAATACRH